jgi:hypothetical protein
MRLPLPVMKAIRIFCNANSFKLKVAPQTLTNATLPLFSASIGFYLVVVKEVFSIGDN